MKKDKNCNTRYTRYIHAAWILLLLALGVMVFSGYKLWTIQQIYAEGDQSYEALRDLVRKEPAKRSDDVVDPTENPDAAPEEEPVALSNPGIDFATLLKVNPDTIAWLHSPDTVIDYPVMRAIDYSWYLHHLPDGTYNANGTLFLDYNCPADFSSRLSIIYGHNMQSGKMFGTLTQYKTQAYFDQHPAMYLDAAENGSYRIDLLYGCVIGAGQWRERAFMYETNLNALLSYAASNTTFASAATYGEADRFLVLSTCSYEFDDARYVVIGVLRS